MLAVSVWLAPTNVWLYKAAFGLVAGPLTWSIVALRNSLVLHSLDQVGRALCKCFGSGVYAPDPKGGDTARGAVTVVWFGRVLYSLIVMWVVEVEGVWG